LNGLPSVAAIDLGTNTFHLLIVRPQPGGGWEELYRKRYFVKLADAGMETIGEAPLARAKDALLSFSSQLDAYQVSSYRAIGTAALRTATNGPELVNWALEETGIKIVTISGDEEARLITVGVQAAILSASPPERQLIMDIGGGSVEFIIASGRKVEYAQSFPVGVAVLRKQFHRNEPINASEKMALNDYLEKAFAPLRSILKKLPSSHLVGSAGTFDVIAKLMGTSNPTPQSRLIDLQLFAAYEDRVINADLDQRMNMSDLPEDRADMMVVALLLIKNTLAMARIEQCTVSYYSMKEGILIELIRSQADKSPPTPISGS
jgi:exopolyphosphatase/guanosine-5'-triphosphate,3'-diphosphate pyrophosphatase